MYKQEAHALLRLPERIDRSSSASSVVVCPPFCGGHGHGREGTTREKARAAAGMACVFSAGWVGIACYIDDVVSSYGNRILSTATTTSMMMTVMMIVMMIRMARRRKASYFQPSFGRQRRKAALAGGASASALSAALVHWHSAGALGALELGAGSSCEQFGGDKRRAAY